MCSYVYRCIWVWDIHVMRGPEIEVGNPLQLLILKHGLLLCPVLTSAGLVCQLVLETPLLLPPNCWYYRQATLPSWPFTWVLETLTPILVLVWQAPSLHWAISHALNPSFLKPPVRCFVTATRRTLRGCTERTVLTDCPVLCCNIWDNEFTVRKGLYQLQY